MDEESSVFVDNVHLFDDQLNLNHVYQNSSSASWRTAVPCKNRSTNVSPALSKAEIEMLTCNLEFWNAKDHSRQKCTFIGEDKIDLIMHCVQNHFDFLKKFQRTIGPGFKTQHKVFPKAPFDPVKSKSAIACDLVKCRTCHFHSMLTTHNKNALTVRFATPVSPESVQNLNDYLRKTGEENDPQEQTRKRIQTGYWNMIKHKCHSKHWASSQLKNCFDYATVCKLCSKNFATSYQLLIHRCENDPSNSLIPLFAIYHTIPRELSQHNYAKLGDYPHEETDKEVDDEFIKQFKGKKRSKSSSKVIEKKIKQDLPDFQPSNSSPLDEMENLSIDGAVLNSVAQIAETLAPCKSLVNLSLILDLQNGVQSSVNNKQQLPVLPSVKSLRLFIMGTYSQQNVEQLKLDVIFPNLQILEKIPWSHRFE